MKNGEISDIVLEDEDILSDRMAEYGSLGGHAIVSKYGTDYMSKIGKRGARNNILRNGIEQIIMAGRRGGDVMRDSKDREYYSRIGKMGALAKKNKRCGL